jgi:hypothetical protein
MTITISSEDPRSIKAIQIAAGAGQWLKCRTVDGVKAYGIPSQFCSSRYYLVDCQTCTCEDAKRHARQACKHQLAVRLHCELAKAQTARPATRHRLPVRATTADYDRIFSGSRRRAA